MNRPDLIDLEMVKGVTDKLGEHFDSVQIFCTRHEEGQENGTISVVWGSGNFYARYGHIHKWLIEQEQEFVDYEDEE